MSSSATEEFTIPVIPKSIESPSNNLTWIDFTVIGAYFLIILGVGLYSSYRSKRSSMQGYFLASRNMHWLPVGASLFASNIGSGHFIGLAGSGAASGIGIAGYELSAIFTLMILGWIFVPVYMASGVYTMPEYLRLRFGGQRIRVYLAVLALMLYVFTKISADLYAGALFIQLALGLHGDEGLYVSIIVLLAIAALFTIAGGLTAVIWTDFVQTILMMAGAGVLSYLSINAVGGYDELIRKFMTEAEPTETILGPMVHHEQYFSKDNNNTCGKVPDDAMHLIRDYRPGASDLPWTGMVFGLPFTSIWYFCSDQVIVQRALASKDMTHAKSGCLLAGVLKLTPLFLLVLPGMAARVLYTNRVACADPSTCFHVCGSTTGCTNIAYAELVMRLMPVGLSGLMLAVMMAALMSSLTSIFNSSSTIFTIDIWTRLRRKPSDKELLLVGRLSVLVLLGISVLWVPILKGLKASQLFVYIQQVQNFLSPPITAIYLMALFIPRVNESGAFWGLMVGLVMGSVRFFLEFTYVSPPCGSGDLDLRPDWVKTYVGDVHYLHYAGILFVVTFIVCLVVSLMTEPIKVEKLERLTFWSRYSTKVREDMESTPSTPEKVIRSEYPMSTTGILNPIIKIDDESATGNESSVNGPALSQIENGVREETRKDSVESEGGKLRRVAEQEALAAANFLRESAFWKWTVNIAAVIIAGLNLALWVYYA